MAVSLGFDSSSDKEVASSFEASVSLAGAGAGAGTTGEAKEELPEGNAALFKRESKSFGHSHVSKRSSPVSGASLLDALINSSTSRST